MTSWQFRLFRRAAADYMRKQTAVRLTEDLAQTRQDLEGLAMRARLPKGCRAEPLMIDTMAAEWIVPAETTNGRVILYLHGGAYCLGSIQSHRFLAGYLAHGAQAKVLLIDYRLGPEHPFPGAVEDAAAAYRFLLQQGVASQNITIAGDSAGGGLALAALVMLRDAGEPLPQTAVCLSPWVDLARTGNSMETKRAVDLMLSPELLGRYATLYLNGDEATNPLASPLYADLAGLPPLLIQVGSEEILLDDATRLAEKAQAAGVAATLEVWPEMLHVWPALSMIIPEGKQAIARIGAFVKNGENLREA